MKSHHNQSIISKLKFSGLGLISVRHLHRLPLLAAFPPLPELDFQVSAPVGGHEDAPVEVVEGGGHPEGHPVRAG